MCLRRLWLYVAALGVPLIGGVATLWLETAVMHTPIYKAFVIAAGVALILVGCLLSDILEERNARYQRDAPIYQRLPQSPSDPSL